MGFRDTFVGNMRSWVGVPYVYGGARPLTDAYLGQPTDCSGAVVVAAEKADPGCTGGASYTGDMRERFTSTGRWTWHDGVEGLRPGDVVLTPKAPGVVGHTAVVDFDGGLLEEYPPQGRKVEWYGYPWDGYLSHVDDGEDGGDETEGRYGNMVEVILNPATFTVQDALNVRTGPGLGYDVVATYRPGETVHVDGMLYAEGYVWGFYIGRDSGQVRYVAVGPVDFQERYLL